MKPPKCKSCGVEEWRHVCGQPLQFSKVSKVTISADGSAVIQGRNTDNRMIREGRKNPFGASVTIDPSLPDGVLQFREPETGKVLASITHLQTEKPPFDRNAYQRQYMADQKLARAEGLTVKQWREKHHGDK